MNDKELKVALENTVEQAEVHTGQQEAHDLEAQDAQESGVNEQLSEEIQEPVETPQQRNFKNLKSKLKETEDKLAEIERQRDEAFRYAQMAQGYTQPPMSQQREEEIADDELIEARHLKTYQRKMEERFKKYEADLQFQTTEAKIKARFPDFDDIVTTDSLKKLAKLEPEMARTLDSAQDLYSKAVSAYKLIKKLDSKDEDSYELDQIRVQQNVKKPRTATSIAPTQNVTPLSRANAFNQPLTDEMKDKIIAEMEAAIRNKAY